MHSELIDTVVSERGFATKFSPEEEQAAEQSAEQAATKAAAAPNDGGNRLDYRDKELITIDGADAHDFDDAVGCRRQAHGGILLTVAIADVSAYFAPDSPLDAAAQQRGNSVYLPDRVLPMLPARLSNDACSLRPREDRLCLCCEMDFDADARLNKYRFFRAVIRSATRMTYDEAADVMEGRTASTLATPALLWELGRRLREQRAARGGMLLEKPEKYCEIVRKNGGEKELKIGTRQRNVAHWAIEEAMIAANRCAADFLICHKRPALHRIHTKPSAEKIRQLSETLSPMGFNLPARPQAADFATVLMAAEARDVALGDALTPLVLGTLSRAEYAPDEKTGHFGLACERYMHFTSPIRRYPDLLTHRAIVAVMEGRESPFDAGQLMAVGSHCGEAEVNADKAGWESRQRLLCEEAKGMIGCEYEGYVSGVAPMGFFVSVGELGIDGMVRFSNLSGYWRCDAKKTSASSDDATIRIGDKINAQLVAIMSEKGRADFIASDFTRR